jgi:hypothetical protein
MRKTLRCIVDILYLLHARIKTLARIQICHRKVANSCKLERLKQVLEGHYHVIFGPRFFINQTYLGP